MVYPVGYEPSSPDRTFPRVHRGQSMLGGERDDPLPVGPHKGLVCDEQRIGPVLGHRGKGARQLLGRLDAIELQREAELPRRGQAFTRKAGSVPRSRIPEDGQVGDFRDGLLEELEPFPIDVEVRAGCARDPRDVAAGVGEARDQPLPHGVIDILQDDRDRGGRLHGRPDTGGKVDDHDQVRLKPYEFRRHGWGTLCPRLRPPALDDEVLAREIPVLPQPLHEGLPVRTARSGTPMGVRMCRRWGSAPEEPDAIDLPRRLPGGGDRDGKEGESQGNTEDGCGGLHGDVLSLLHSVASNDPRRVFDSRQKT